MRHRRHHVTSCDEPAGFHRCSLLLLLLLLSSGVGDGGPSGDGGDDGRLSTATDGNSYNPFVDFILRMLQHRPNSTPEQESRDSRVMLCDHPPSRFNPGFAGHRGEKCGQKHTAVKFLTTLNLCINLFVKLYSQPDRKEDVLFLTYEMLLPVNESFVNLCLPLFRRFENCTEAQYFTTCGTDDKVGFLHSHGCKRKSTEDKFFEALLVLYLMDNKTRCFHETCEGLIRVIESNVGGVTFQLFNYYNPRFPADSPQCLPVLRHLDLLLQEHNKTLYLTQNSEWPCCYPLYFVAWVGQPEEQGLSGGWSYLSTSCLIGEAMLMMLMGAVAVSGVVGNLTVLMVMVSSAHRGQESSILRTSLALSDLLTAMFVVVPSFCYHISRFFSTPQYLKIPRLISENTASLSDSDARNQEQYLADEEVSSEWFPLFQSVMFACCSVVSLLNMFLISFERFVLTGRVLKYRHYIEQKRVLAATVFIWLLCLVQGVLGHRNKDGTVSATWLKFSKLPLGTRPDTEINTIDSVTFFHVVRFVTSLTHALSTLATLVFSVLSIRNFMREKARVAEERKSCDMKACPLYDQDDRRILVTLILIPVFFSTRTVTYIIQTFVNFYGDSSFDNSHFAVPRYLLAWMRVASVAWNPWLYNFRSSQFTDDLKKLWRRVIHCWRRRVQTPQEVVMTPRKRYLLQRVGLELPSSCDTPH